MEAIPQILPVAASAIPFPSFLKNKFRAKADNL
jgi:hypothetical protein